MFDINNYEFFLFKRFKNNYYRLFNSYYVFSVCIGFLIILLFLIFLTLVETRNRFFLVESISENIYKIESHNGIKSGFLFQERDAILKAYVKKTKDNDFEIVFDDGSIFLLNKNNNDIKNYLIRRRNNIIFSALVMRHNSDKNSRIAIWSDKKIKFLELRGVLNFFATYGFDSFDIAVEVESQKGDSHVT